MEGIRGGHVEHGMLVGFTSSVGGYYINRYGSQLGTAGKVAANAALSGVVAEIGGGKFASGAMTGAFIMMYNELQHPKSDIMLRQKLKRKIERDGKLTLSEAMKWYKKGNGETIEVDINSLNLDFLITEVQGKPIGYVFCFSTIRGGIGQFLVYGSLTAKYYGDNMIRLYNDTYNFEPHSTSDEHLRNIETEIGNFVHGQGTPFQIHFNGTYTIKNAFEQFSNRLSKSPL